MKIHSLVQNRYISVSCRHVSPTMNSIPTPSYVISDISEITWYVAVECDRLTPSPAGANSIALPSQGEILNIANVQRKCTRKFFFNIHDFVAMDLVATIY